MSSALPALADTGCVTWAGTPGSATLAQTIHDNSCVSIAAGTFDVPGYIVVPAGHTVSGASAATTILRAESPWDANGDEGVLNVLHDGDGVTISNLTLDANHLATDAVAARGMSLSGVTLENAVCNGAGIAGRNVTISSSTITGNGAACPVDPPGAGVYITGNNSPSRDLAPVLNGNDIEGNAGPGIDIDGAWNGRITGNTVKGNGSWAAISLFGAQGWGISSNQASQPDTSATHPHEPLCRPGSASGGAGTAGILLCQSTDNSNGLATFGNTISNNTVSGHYGLLVLGQYAQNLPSRNTLDGNTVTAPLGCADEQRGGTADSNVWSNNHCGGGQPAYFPTTPCFDGGGAYSFRISPARAAVRRGGSVTLAGRLLQDGRACGAGLPLRLMVQGARASGFHLSRTLHTGGGGLGRTTYTGLRATFRWYLTAPANGGTGSPVGVVTVS